MWRAPLTRFYIINFDPKPHRYIHCHDWLVCRPNYTLTFWYQIGQFHFLPKPAGGRVFRFLLHVGRRAAL